MKYIGAYGGLILALGLASAGEATTFHMEETFTYEGIVPAGQAYFGPEEVSLRLQFDASASFQTHSLTNVSGELSWENTGPQEIAFDDLYISSVNGDDGWILLGSNVDGPSIDGWSASLVLMRFDLGGPFEVPDGGVGVITSGTPTALSSLLDGAVMNAFTVWLDDDGVPSPIYFGADVTGTLQEGALPPDFGGPGGFGPNPGTPAVPLPASVWLLSAAVAALGARRRRKPEVAA